MHEGRQTNIAFWKGTADLIRTKCRIDSLKKTSFFFSLIAQYPAHYLKVFGLLCFFQNACTGSHYKMVDAHCIILTYFPTSIAKWRETGCALISRSHSEYIGLNFLLKFHVTFMVGWVPPWNLKLNLKPGCNYERYIITLSKHNLLPLSFKSKIKLAVSWKFLLFPFWRFPWFEFQEIKI